MVDVEALPPLPAEVPALAPHAPAAAGAPALQPTRLHSSQQTASPPPPRQPIHERYTASSRLHALVDPQSESAAAIKALLRSKDRLPASATTLPQLHAGVAEYARTTGDSMRELVARKRQIFLAQMSLDTKHGEIAKLEQRTRQWEEALVASEAALQEDSQRFEKYLKENDDKLQEALKRADAEARARADKAAEAKRLAASIAAVRSDMSKIEEQLQECQTLKEFIDSVTPEEWFESRVATRNAKKAEMRAAWQAQCDAIAQRKQGAAAARQRAEHDMQWARTQQQFERAERAHREAVVALRDALAEQAPPEPDYSALDGEEEGMYFQEPAQLLAVFSQLEGSNMFQIQIAQDAEAALEAAKVQHAATTAELDAEAAELRRQVAQLEASVAASRERCKRLQAAARHSLDGGGSGLLGSEGSAGNNVGESAGAARSSSGDGGSQQHSQQQQHGPRLGALAEAVAVGYEAAGFARDASVTPLQMLQKMEARLEEWLAAIGPPNGPMALLVEQVEKAREKERRQASRAEKLAAQQAEHEARVARVLARAAAPKFQKVGKPVMTRSMLQRTEQGEGKEREGDAEEELRAFLALVDEAIPTDH